jgi:pimeloyl-ACP methyl ester carboxylesterase
MAHAIVNGARLWYDVWGSGDPLLFHHGYTASRDNWMPVAERLASRYRVVLMECRGAGDSEHTESGYSLEQYAQDAIGIGQHLHLGRFTFAGHSMGGGVGYLLATRFPEVLSRLVLMAPIPSGGIKSFDFDGIEEHLRARNRGDREYFKALMRASRFRPDVQTEEWFERRINHLFKLSEGHVRGSAESMFDFNVVKSLSSVLTPTLVIAGAFDELLQANFHDYQLLPNATLHVFSRAGHDVAIHEPDGVADAIDAFMRNDLPSR